jgi:cardiolipin synthase A/B
MIRSNGSSSDGPLAPSPSAQSRTSGVWKIAGKSHAEEDACKLLRGSAASFAVWLKAIAEAEHEVLLEMYWFASDKVGHAFADALRKRAKDGLDVFVLADGFGSFESIHLLNSLRDSGVHVLWYNPMYPWTPGFRVRNLGKRDHRKLLVIDGARAFVGGINLTEKSEPWHDYSVQVVNKTAQALRALFFDSWKKVRGPNPRHLPVCTAGLPAKTLRHQARAELEPVSTQKFHVQGHASWTAHRAIRRLYLRRIRDAKKRIIIENAYFVPDAFVRNALARASQRGVDVHVLVPQVSDVPSVDFASRAAFGKLLAAGVHIHLWTKGVLHAKVAVIDDWATLGSYNFDYRSLFHNLEVNVSTTHEPFVRELADDLATDLKEARELDPAQWKNRALLTRGLEWMAYQFRKFL